MPRAEEPTGAETFGSDWLTENEAVAHACCDWNQEQKQTEKKKGKLRQLQRGENCPGDSGISHSAVDEGSYPSRYRYRNIQHRPAQEEVHTRKHEMLVYQRQASENLVEGEITERFETHRHVHLCGT